MRILVLLLLCSCAHAPLAPAPVAPNHARAIASAVETSDTKCVLWTGRETPYGGVDSMVCVGPMQMIYIKAPDDAEPQLKVFLQTEAPSPPPRKAK